MAEFMARVELHHAAGEDYQLLHQAMDAHGFRRVARATDGRYYHLPTGMYWVESMFTTREVLGFAQTVIFGLGKTGEVTVTQSTETWFAGLPLV